MNKKLLFTSIIITFIYGILTLNTVLYHEVWADEAQVWQLCSHLNLFELIKHLSNEGHPALFYILVMPFAKLFSNIIYMKLICWAFMAASVFLLVYYSPFKIYTKLAIILSAGFLYFFPVLARNYSIIPFLVFLAAILYNKSKEHPILYATTLALIANTHIIMFCFTAILGIDFYYQNILLNIRNKQIQNLKKYILPFFIICFGCLIVFYMLCDTTNNNVFLKIDLTNLSLAIQRILLLFFINAYNYDIGINLQLYKPLLDVFLIFSMIILYILCFINLFKRSKKLFSIALLSILFQLAIYIFAYNSFVYVNRIFCSHIILIFCLWLSINNNSEDKKGFSSILTTNILLTLFFGLTIYNGINYTQYDLKMDYSGAKSTAEYIKKNINPETSLLLIDNEPYMISLAYYLKDTHKLYSVFRKKDLEYVRWDNTTVSNYADLGWSQYVSYMHETTPKDLYVINVSSDKKHIIEETQKDFFKLIFKSPKSIEKYEGYRIFEYIGK